MCVCMSVCVHVYGHPNFCLLTHHAVPKSFFLHRMSPQQVEMKEPLSPKDKLCHWLRKQTHMQLVLFKWYFSLTVYIETVFWVPWKQKDCTPRDSSCVYSANSPSLGTRTSFCSSAVLSRKLLSPQTHKTRPSNVRPRHACLGVWGWIQWTVKSFWSLTPQSLISRTWEENPVPSWPTGVNLTLLLPHPVLFAVVLFGI